MTIHEDGIPVGKDFVVNTNSIDNICSPTQCHLAGAINASNHNPGRDTIKFNLPSNHSSYTSQRTT